MIVRLTISNERDLICNTSISELERDDVRVNKTDHEQDTNPNPPSNTVHHHPAGIEREGGVSYPPFVPGANEGELFGEVHTQYEQSVSNDTEPVEPIIDGLTTKIESRSIDV